MRNMWEGLASPEELACDDKKGAALEALHAEVLSSEKFVPPPVDKYADVPLPGQPLYKWMVRDSTNADVWNALPLSFAFVIEEKHCHFKYARALLAHEMSTCTTAKDEAVVEKKIGRLLASNISYVVFSRRTMKPIPLKKYNEQKVNTAKGQERVIRMHV